MAEFSTLQPRVGISQDFLQQQQFKVLADLVSGSSTGAAETESVRAALAAFSLATERHVPLVGINDLNRWQAVPSLIRADADQQGSALKYQILMSS